jgi:mono/diheme cytochrome c family protein
VFAPEGWLNWLIQLLQTSQLWLLQALRTFGLTGDADGQAAWPWAQRLSGENLIIDLGQARSLALTLIGVTLALALILLAVFWRRVRWTALIAAAVVLLLAPWPESNVIFVPATPASFHRSTSGYSVDSIAQGGQLYAQHCAACHGSDGKGQTALGRQQIVWPPNLSGPLLWRRADGDLFWRIRHGVTDRQGRSTMQAFGGQLDVAQTWAVLDFLKAQAAGQMLREAGSWPWPIALPDMTVQCQGHGPKALSAWQGQRVRIVLADANREPPREDPRLLTIWVTQQSKALNPQAECQVNSTTAWNALALMAGGGKFAGSELLADRQGWLRARSQSGAWSQDDLICHSANLPVPSKAEGLGAVIALMDAEPVRFVKGGFVH